MTEKLSQKQTKTTKVGIGSPSFPLLPSVKSETMKKLLALALLTAALTATAQTTNTNTAWFFWVSSPVATNLTLGNQVIPLNSLGDAGLKWATKSWNQSFNLVGTNRLGWKDAIAYAVWTEFEQWGAKARAEADARENIQKIKAALPDAPDNALSNIYWLLFNQVMP